MNKKIERIKTSLQIDEDIDLHVTSWVIQRVGWGLMLVVIALAMLGLFGNGVLSEKQVVADDASLRYERFARYESNTSIEVKAMNPPGSLVVAFSAAFARSFKVEQINPEPAEQKIESGSTVYVFKTRGTGEATFFVSPRRRGYVKYDVRVNDTAFHPVSLIYP